MPVVHAPAAGFTGEVVGVPFVDGTATTDDPVALGYFRRHGYQVVSSAPEPDTPSGPPTGAEETPPPLEANPDHTGPLPDLPASAYGPDSTPLEDTRPVRPAVNDPKAAWIGYAIASGGDPDEVAAFTKAQLIEAYG